MINKETGNALRYAVIISLGGFVFGYDASVISGVVGFVTREFSLTPIQQGMVVSASTLAAVFASLTVGPLADLLGRKRMLQFLALLYTISAIFSALADSYWSLVIARGIGGYAFGSLFIAPIYIAELSPAPLRGRLVSVNQLNIVVGLSAAYFVNYFIQSAAATDADWVTALSVDTHTWNWMLGVEALPALIWLLLISFVPRSPRWLASQGRWDEARRVIGSISGRDRVEAAVAEIRHAVGEQSASILQRLRELISNKTAFVLMIGLIVAIVQQITGINIVFFYATTIFEQSGVGTNAAFAQAISIGLVNIVFTLIAISMIDSLGRRPLMIAGLAGVAVSMAVVAWGFHQATYTLDDAAIAAGGLSQFSSELKSITGAEYASDIAFKKDLAALIGDAALRDNEAQILNAAMSANAGLILAGILGFVASFALSLGPVMWVILSEIFPVRIRGLAVSLVTIFNSGTSWLVQLLFPWSVANIGSAGVFLSFSVFAIVGLALVVWLLPETKGASLEQLEERFAKSTR